MLYPHCVTVSGSPAARSAVLRAMAESEIDGAVARVLLEVATHQTPAPVAPSVRDRASSDAGRAVLGVVSRVAALVQSWPYLLDPGTVIDRICPLRDLPDNGGDCEDKAKAVVVLCRTAGIPADFLWMVQDSTFDHVTALVRIPGAGWCYVETTLRAYVGENPYRAAARLDGRTRLGLEVRA